MKNPLTVSIESYIGIAFLGALSLFLIIFLFSVSKKFESGLDAISLQIERTRAAPFEK